MESGKLAKLLTDKIDQKNAVVSIVGLGYVGLPLLLCFVEKGFHCVGFDIDLTKIESLKSGRSYIKHIPSKRIEEANATARLEVTNNFSRLSGCDAIIICVPTPLNKNREPDLKYIVGTSEAIGAHVRTGQLIVLESTTYPGTTEEVVIPILEKKGLVADKDFFVAFSPEREDPNNSQYTTETIPKVIGSTSEDGLKVAERLYGKIVKKTVPVSSTRVAEATKLMENIFRSVNIALVNELKVTFMKMGIDVWEVIDAAKTKPFGYMPFYPGPGLGGHCIPIDPFYLTWKAREYGITTRFIELAGEINTSMPEFVVTRVTETLNRYGRPVRGARILLLGLAYKANVDDYRESPSFRIMESLEERGAKVDYNDPHIPVIGVTREFPKYEGRKSVSVSGNYDLILIATAHDEYKFIEFVKFGIPIVDTRNIVKVKSDLVAQA